MDESSKKCDANEPADAILKLLKSKPQKLLDEAEKTVNIFTSHMPQRMKDLDSIRQLREPSIDEILGYYYDRYDTSRDSIDGEIYISNFCVITELVRSGGGFEIKIPGQECVATDPLTDEHLPSGNRTIRAFSIHTSLATNPFAIISMLAIELGIQGVISDEDVSMTFDNLSLNPCVYGYVSTTMNKILMNALKEAKFEVVEICLGYHNGNRALMAFINKFENLSSSDVQSWFPIQFLRYEDPSNIEPDLYVIPRLKLGQ